MKCFRFCIVVSTIAYLMSCSMKTATNAGKEEDNSKQVLDYVIDEKLSSIDYNDIEGFSPKEGLIPTAEIAFKVAETVLKQIYGNEKIESEKPFSINLENDVWIIEGHLDAGLLGGVAYMEIRKTTGEILKVIHGK